MGIDIAMKEALASRPDAVALACMDTRSGLLLGIQVRGDVPRDDVEVAAFSAAQLCSAPQAVGLGDNGDPDAEEECDESFVASSRWVHAYARVPSRRDLALLRAWIREVADRVGPQA